MGYGKRSNGICTFWPDNTATEFYIATSSSISLKDAIEQAAAYFKTSTYELMCDAEIQAEWIHTDCLSYDSYDSGDYTNFIRIEYKRKG
jgi:hypothetical protein